MIFVYTAGIVILGTFVESIVTQAVRSHIDGRAAADFKQLREGLSKRYDSRTEDRIEQSVPDV